MVQILADRHIGIANILATFMAYGGLTLPWVTFGCAAESCDIQAELVTGSVTAGPVGT